jgi:tRNA/rRNA methyltransferase
MVQNLRVVLNRAGMTEQEIRTWRGVVTALTKGRGKVLARLAKDSLAKSKG